MGMTRCLQWEGMRGRDPLLVPWHCGRGRGRGHHDLPIHIAAIAVAKWMETLAALHPMAAAATMATWAFLCKQQRNELVSGSYNVGIPYCKHLQYGNVYNMRNEIFVPIL